MARSCTLKYKKCSSELMKESWRLVESQRWDKDLVNSMKGTPKRPDPNMPGLDTPIRVNIRPEDPSAIIDHMARNRASEAPRSVYLKKSDFEKYGYTPGCEGCKRMRSGVFGYKNYTTECRRRIETCLSEEKHLRYMKEH